MTRPTGKIKALRILPPLAIGRLGSADEPLDNYTISVDDQATLGFRRSFRQRHFSSTLSPGEISEGRAAENMTFTSDGKIRPVAPFLEVFAVTEDDSLVPLTTEYSARAMAHPGDCALARCALPTARSSAARKTRRRYHGRDEWFSHHDKQPLLGRCAISYRRTHAVASATSAISGPIENSTRRYACASRQPRA